MFKSIEDHLAAWADSASADVVKGVHSFIAYMRDEEGKVAAAIADLKAKGFQVLKDGVEQ